MIPKDLYPITVKLKLQKPRIWARAGAVGALARQQKYSAACASYLCLMDLKSGQGTEADWNTLQLRLVVGLKLAQDYFNNEALVEMHRALVVLSCIHASVAGRANGWYVTLDEALLLGPALWLTDMMQEQCSSQESAKSIHAAQVALGLS